MAALSEYTNVHDTALKLILKKGFRVWHDKEQELYCAEKIGWDFKAETPCSLLGLIAIYEQKQPIEFEEYWWKEDGEDIFMSLTTNKPKYEPVWSKKRRINSSSQH